MPTDPAPKPPETVIPAPALHLIEEVVDVAARAEGVPAAPAAKIAEVAEEITEDAAELVVEVETGTPLRKVAADALRKTRTLIGHLMAKGAQVILPNDEGPPKP